MAVSNTRILDIGWVQGYIFWNGDTLISHGTGFSEYWRYDFNSFFLNHKGTAKLTIPTNMRNSIYDFLHNKANLDVGVDLQIPLDSNYYFPSSGYGYKYKPNYSYEVRYGLFYYCSAPLDSRIFFRGGFTDVKALNNNIFSLVSYPNPSSKELNISYTLTQNDNAKILLYDLEGRMIRESLEDVDAGEHVMKWNVSQLQSGSYVLGLVTEKERKSLIIQITH